jgi:DNA topoisomerase IB
MTDRRVARIIKACQELPGQELLQYIDEVGCCRDVSSADINGYLRDITGRDVTAKDFRTFGGTILAALALHELGPGNSKRSVRIAVERVAARLGNTPTICRKCYVHPEVINAYLDGALHLEIAQTIDPDSSFGLTAAEAAVIARSCAPDQNGRATARQLDTTKRPPDGLQSPGQGHFASATPKPLDCPCRRRPRIRSCTSCSLFRLVWW